MLFRNICFVMTCVVINSIFSHNILCCDQKKFEFYNELGIISTNNSLMLDRFISTEHGHDVKRICIYSSVDPSEAKEIVRCVHKHAGRLGPSLKEIKVLSCESDSLVINAILPMLRELITPSNGFNVLEDPWWEPSYGRQLLEWTHSFFSSNKEQHIKVH